MARKKYYAVAIGRTIGIFKSWFLANRSVTKYENSTFKGFATLAEARLYLRDYGIAHPTIYEPEDDTDSIQEASLLLGGVNEGDNIVIYPPSPIPTHNISITCDTNARFDGCDESCSSSGSTEHLDIPHSSPTKEDDDEITLIKRRIHEETRNASLELSAIPHSSHTQGVDDEIINARFDGCDELCSSSGSTEHLDIPHSSPTKEDDDEITLIKRRIHEETRNASLELSAIPHSSHTHGCDELCSSSDQQNI